MTVALPTISAAGIEAVGIPTALLSNHTAFPSWTFTDLSSDILKVVRKWDEKDRVFDAVYTGYLTTSQVMDVIEVFRLCKASKLRFVDPAFADHGKLYAGFEESHIEAMRSLIREADIIKPNVTEACFLTGHPMIHGLDSEQTFLELAKTLAEYGPSVVIISGAHIHEGKQGCYLYKKEKQRGQLLEFESLPGLYHGTGDLFASALISAIVRGAYYEDAILLAHNLVADSIQRNLDSGVDGLRYGPEFENELKHFAESLQETLIEYEKGDCGFVCP